MMYKILKLDEDKWTKFEFIHYYPGKFSLFLFLLDHLGLLINRIVNVFALAKTTYHDKMLISPRFIQKGVASS